MTATSEPTGPERIFLEPDCCVDWANQGRQWSPYDEWGDDCTDHQPPTEYVRADLVAQKFSPVERTKNAWIRFQRNDRQLATNIKAMKKLAPETVRFLRWEGIFLGMFVSAFLAIVCLVFLGDTQ